MTGVGSEEQSFYIDVRNYHVRSLLSGFASRAKHLEAGGLVVRTGTDKRKHLIASKKYPQEDLNTEVLLLAFRNAPVGQVTRLGCKLLPTYAYKCIQSTLYAVRQS